MSRFDDEDEIPIPAGMRREFDRLKGTSLTDLMCSRFKPGPGMALRAGHARSLQSEGDVLSGETAAVARARMLLRCVEEQVDKRQYLNAVDAANELVSALLRALSSRLKEPAGEPPGSPPSGSTG